jgi:hypothetical protein
VFGQEPAVPAADATESELPPEPDYAEVAADARKIADEIEQRLIEAKMDDAQGYLFEADAVQGHPPADAAYRQMEEMISFCNSTGGKASNCPFKLSISMPLNPGNTIGQLGRGLVPGEGFSGMVGNGANGYAGSRSRFGLYGPRSAGDRSRMSSRLGDVKTESQAMRDPGRDPLAGNVEELSSGKRDDLGLTAESEGRVIEEYRPLIEAYFKRLAEEKP